MYNTSEFDNFVLELSKYVLLIIRNGCATRLKCKSICGNDILIENTYNKIVFTSHDVSVCGDSVNIHVDEESKEVFVNVFLNEEIIGDVVLEYTFKKETS